MARIILPTRFADQAKLVNDINAKHTADAIISILTPFFTENEIVIADDVAAVASAQTFHTTFEQNARDAEKLFKERDRLFNPIFAQHRRKVQYLKKLYAKNIGKLGDWGVTVNGNRIEYPTDIIGKMDAVRILIEKHQSYAPAISPLDAFLNEETNSDIDMTTNLANTATARTNHTDAVALNNTKETNRANRDLRMETPVKNATLTGNFLMGHFSANPNKAGDWGFTVDTSPQGTKIRTGFVNIGSDKVLANLAVGGVLINNSEFNIELFSGKIPEGTPVTLAPGKPFLIVTGYGTLTVRNPNDEQKAFYQGVFNR